MQSTDVIRLELDRYANRPTVFAVRGDIGSRFVEIMLLRRGVPYTVPDGVTAVLRCRRADGSVVKSVLSANDGTLAAELTEEMLAVPGIAECVAELSDGSGVIGTTQPFRIKVQFSPFAAEKT